MTVLTLQAGQSIQRDDLIQLLTGMGYERVPMVVEMGVYSVKGSVIDIFPVNHQQPLRCDCFGDVLDRLTSFRLDTQRSIRVLDSTAIQPVDACQFKRFEYDYRVMDSELVANINAGDYVVHERYGIGIFRGFTRLVLANHQEGEYVFIQFKGNDKLYMPLDQIPLLHKYVGQKPRLSGLHDGSWRTIRRKADRALDVLAADIYDLHKQRQRIKGYAFEPDTDAQLDFESYFPYDETPDQLSAIAAIKLDMEAPRPMDRLLCGDVGFGKTEVMLRAAAKAVFSSKQVLVLVPTTILADQHYHTFKQRFAAFPVNVGRLSRMAPPAEIQQTIRALKQQHMDIVIGTHRLLQSDVSCNNLGLLIIDEEQRFGVRHKHKLKQMAMDVDTLSVSATPIPRTLYLSLSGSTAISQLTTPPKGREPIQTIVAEYNDDLLVTAIQQELDRGGQVYFLHNHIHELDAINARLASLVPSCRVCIAHGQMRPVQLDSIMQQFYRHDFDLLLCTSIIENGLDIPNVNTIIVNRSDQLGLSQIHQIRGRVGRSDRRAYAYILYPKETALSDASKERLQVLKEAVGLGVGYQLAMKDLAIRGAGTMLGERQSGHLTAIGFDLYCKLLSDRLNVLRGHSESPVLPLKSLKAAPNVFIPDHYINNDQERLAMYRRCLQVGSSIQLKRLILECKDRYGRIPNQMHAFLQAIECTVSH